MKEYKNIQVSENALKNVMQVKRETKRTLIGTADFLIQKGYELYLQENNFLAKSKMNIETR